MQAKVIQDTANQRFNGSLLPYFGRRSKKGLQKTCPFVDQNRAGFAIGLVCEQQRTSRQWHYVSGAMVLGEVVAEDHSTRAPTTSFSNLEVGMKKRGNPLRIILLSLRGSYL